jgi:osmoprotectant transport system permease protein
MSYLLREPALVAGLAVEHLTMTLTALFLAGTVALPAGIAAARSARLSAVVNGILGVVYTVPSLALMILLIPVIGLNRTNVVIALVVYAQVILVRNVIAGLQAIDPSVRESAVAMGMNSFQRLRRVDLPLAIPVVLAGVRVAAVVCIAIATVGAKLSAGGLGTLLFAGVQQHRYDKIVAGSLAVGALALGLNLMLWLAERRLTPHRRASGRPDRVDGVDPAMGTR